MFIPKDALLKTFALFCAIACGHNQLAHADSSMIKTDLLIVGGTESGCAAAVQAARMGVKSITIVNDIKWLGGQFTAESLVAIDENRPPSGYGNGVPFPRAGIFKEVMDKIEKINSNKFGHPRPGNTRVITTAIPSDAEQAFRELLKPGIDNNTIQIISEHYPVAVSVSKQSLTPVVKSVTFHSTSTDRKPLTVKAKVTIDATDWGDVIRLSGAGYEYGPDLKSKYGEPLAPQKREGYPVTDMNPITYNLLLEETDEYKPIPKPLNYNELNYSENNYPKDPARLYSSRRIVDHYGFPDIKHPDVLLLCYAPFDYPLDVLPQKVVDALEANEKGSSKRNIVDMSRQQRQIVFEDAKQHSLGYLYYLQTVVHDQMKDKSHSFRRFKLSDDFGTSDNLPMKPYVRESLRLHAMHMLKQQETTGYDNNSLNYGNCMFHDGIACFQFEYDYHPTGRRFIENGNPNGAWRNYFRVGRTWGPPYSGLCLFPSRSLIPKNMRGLMGAQKNLGYTSIVSSAVRLHDQSMAIGQGAGAVAATAILHSRELNTIPFDRNMLAYIWNGMCHSSEEPETNIEPVMLWPYRDLSPNHPSFVAVNQLSIRKWIQAKPTEVIFNADEPANPNWINAIVSNTKKDLVDTALIEVPTHSKDLTRGEFAIRWWNQVQGRALKNRSASETDHDLDGIANNADPLPYHRGISSWPTVELKPNTDGLPSQLKSNSTVVKQFNFGGRNTNAVKGFTLDTGVPYQANIGYGWQRDIQPNNRTRSRTLETLRETFLFTRSHDVWECDLPSGSYLVTVCIGDSTHEQLKQNVTVEGTTYFKNQNTRYGRFEEKTAKVKVLDGKLTVQIGVPNGKTNTCLNWIRIQLVE